MSDLVERLRNLSPFITTQSVATEAAARIEALEQENRKLKQDACPYEHLNIDWCSNCGWRLSEIKRFLAYRRDMNNRETHNDLQKNDETEPQFEGVIFSDGTVALRWLTPLRSTSIWPDIETALGVHGHPEYGTEIVWYDDEPPAEWVDQCMAAGVHLAEIPKTAMAARLRELERRWDALPWDRLKDCVGIVEAIHADMGREGWPGAKQDSCAAVRMVIVEALAARDVYHVNHEAQPSKG